MRLSAGRLGRLPVLSGCYKPSSSLRYTRPGLLQPPTTTTFGNSKTRTFTSTMAKFSAAERFLADKAAPYCSLSVAKSFAQLSAAEKKYAHYVGQAAWAGARIIQGQWTPQAERLYDLLILTFSDGGKLADLDALQQRSGVSAQDWEDLLQYTSQVSVVHSGVEIAGGDGMRGCFSCIGTQ